MQLIFGQNPEPFLEAALRSVAWADYLVAVNTDPDSMNGQQNEATVLRVWREVKDGTPFPPPGVTLDPATFVITPLTIRRLPMATNFDFAKARNAALEYVPGGDYVLILDADDVHWPQAEHELKGAVVDGHDIVAVHFWHHCVYKDLWHSTPHRWIMFRYEDGVRFHNTMGGVHEELTHPRTNPGLIGTDRLTYSHYGYIKPARQVHQRWQFYKRLGAGLHEYDESQPDRALDDWPRVCKLFTGEHPPAVRGVLADYPECPPGVAGVGLNVDRQQARPRVGLVMLTWDDADNLRRCLKTLAQTTEPHYLFVVDNGSTDGTVDIVRDYMADNPRANLKVIPEQSLAQALNYGFRAHTGDHPGLVGNEDMGVEYIGWIHPDHTFEWPDWLANLVAEMDAHPEWAKLGASEAGNQLSEPRSGNSQCYIVRRSALEQVGLFDERMRDCGGYEDWLANWQMMQSGWKVMISPTAVVRHDAMSTRRRHDNVDAAKHNAEIYHSVTGTWDPPC